MPNETESHLGSLQFSTTLSVKIPVVDFRVINFFLLESAHLFLAEDSAEFASP